MSSAAGRIPATRLTDRGLRDACALLSRRGSLAGACSGPARGATGGAGRALALGGGGIDGEQRGAGDEEGGREAAIRVRMT